MFLDTLLIPVLTTILSMFFGAASAIGFWLANPNENGIFEEEGKIADVLISGIIIGCALEVVCLVIASIFTPIEMLISAHQPKGWLFCMVSVLLAGGFLPLAKLLSVVLHLGYSCASGMARKIILWLKPALMFFGKPARWLHELAVRLEVRS
ncbi:MAG: hypothetical protein K2X27_02970 [Candidatus Obscuribacterales bacterium]|nr:hypothetical protein [Candidatus Obscuribacterales bacterium]